MSSNLCAPQPEGESLQKRWLGFAAFGIVVAGLAVVGYWRLFTQFMVYDDEGYLLASLRNYCSEGGLYAQTPSIYGPFLHTFYHICYLVTGVVFDHESGRLYTLVWWCAAVGLSGIFCWRQTRSVAVGLAVAMFAFVCLITTIREPMHPGSLLALLVVLGVIIGGEALVREKPVFFAVVNTLLGTAMALTKINVGLFYLIATGGWLLINTRLDAKFRLGALLAGLGGGVFPFLLMQANWQNPAVMTYALLFVCGAMALVVAVYRVRLPEHNWRSWSLGLVGVLVLTAAVLGISWARGMHLADLWEGTVTSPLRQPKSFFVPMDWLGGANGLALAGLGLAGAYYFWSVPGLATLVAGLRIGVAIWFCARIPLLYSESISLQKFCFSYGPSLGWLMVVPLLPAANPAAVRARLWLGWVFIWQTLQAYPVAGSQIGWGSFLWLPLFGIGAHEAALFLAPQNLSAAVRGLGGTVLLGAGLAVLWPIAKTGHDNFKANEPLGLSGAERLHLRSDFTSEFRILSQNVRAHGGRMITYPSMFSFNIWTGQPLLMEHSFGTEVKERALVESLEKDPRALIVINRERLEYLVSGEFLPTGTFHRYFTENFEPAIRVDDYELWIHRGRKIAAYSTARLRPTAPGRCELQVTLAPLPRAVAAIELVRLDPPRRVLQRLTLAAPQTWQLIPIDETGAALAPGLAGSNPAKLTQPGRLVVEFALTQNLPPLKTMEVRLFDEAGGLLNASRFDEINAGTAK